MVMGGEWAQKDARRRPARSRSVASPMVFVAQSRNMRDNHKHEQSKWMWVAVLKE